MKALSTVIVVSFAVGCAAQKPPAYGRVHLTGSPPDARVIVDDVDSVDLATAARFGLKLRAGKHRISVEKPGFFPFDIEIEARENEPVVLHVKLERVPE